MSSLVGLFDVWLRWPLWCLVSETLLMSGLGGHFDLWPLPRLVLDTLLMSGLSGL